MLATYKKYKTKSELLNAIVYNEKGIIFKNGKYDFYYDPAAADFYKKYYKNKSQLKIHEIIYDTESSRIPLYLDIEYKTNSVSHDLLDLYLSLMKEYILTNHNDIFQLGPKTDFKSHFKICCATRKDGKFIKNSYHLIYRNKKKPVCFKTTGQIKTLLKNIDSWILTSKPNHYAQLHCRDETAGLLSDIDVPDLSIYSFKLRQFNSFRCPKALKDLPNSLLKLPEDCDIDDFKNYFVNYCPAKSNVVEIIQSKMNVATANILPKKVIKNNYTEIPKQTICEVKERMACPHKDNGKIIKQSILDDSFKFIIEDTTSNCLNCGVPHSGSDGQYYIIVNLGKYYWGCFNSDKRILLTKTEEGIISHWDYKFEDTTRIDVRLPMLTELKGEGSTFLLESAKGTGKTEAMIKFVKDIDKSKSILLISYRVSLCNKYQSDFAEHGLDFSLYSDKDQGERSRLICCLNSIKNRNEEDPMKWDIIIIDEIYSVLEHFNSDMKNKISNLLYFERYIKGCDYLYCLDAHLNNIMVVDTLKALREPDQFTCWKNTKSHSYEDYTFNLMRIVKNDKNYERDVIINKLLEDVNNNKKIAVVSSTKSLLEYINELLIEKTIDKKIKIYTSATEENIKKNDLSNVETSWKNIDVILYSATISAGVSYNDIDKITGFNKVYAFLKCGLDVPSHNSADQMLARIRQTTDKEMWVYYDDRHTNVCPTIYDIKKDLQRGTSSGLSNLPEPYMNQIGIDENFNNVYNIDHWSYKLWERCISERLYYSNSENYINYVIKSYCNPRDDSLFAGRGMEFIEHFRTGDDDEDLIVREAEKRREDCDNKETIRQYTIISSVYKDPMFNSTTQEDRIVYERFEELCKNYDLSLDKILKEDDAINIIKDIQERHELKKYKRQKEFIKILGIEEHNSYLQNLNKRNLPLESIKEISNKNGLKFPQGLGTEKMIQVQMYKTMVDLWSVVVEKKINNKNVLKIYEKVIEYNNKYKCRDVSHLEVIQNKIYKWQQENTTKDIYDCNRDDWLRINQLEKYGYIDILKEKNWKPTSSKKIRENRIKARINKSWVDSDYKRHTPSCWTNKELKKFVSKIFEKEIGYKIESNSFISIFNNWDYIRF